MQSSTPVKTGKNRFFRFICPDFWTDLNGCQQRLLFTRQLTQEKCSLCSQGTMVSTREFNVDLIGHSLIWPKQVCAAWQSMVLGLLSKPWTGYESQWCMVLMCNTNGCLKIIFLIKKRLFTSGNGLLILYMKWNESGSQKRSSLS